MVPASQMKMCCFTLSGYLFVSASCVNAVVLSAVSGGEEVWNTYDTKLLCIHPQAGTLITHDIWKKSDDVVQR